MARMTNGGGGGRSAAVNIEGVIEGQKVRVLEASAVAWVPHEVLKFLKFLYQNLESHPPPVSNSLHVSQAHPRRGERGSAAPRRFSFASPGQRLGQGYAHAVLPRRPSVRERSSANLPLLKGNANDVTQSPALKDPRLRVAAPSRCSSP